MTKTQISFEDLLLIEKMLNTTNDDYELAISNINNLELDNVYIHLLSKNIRSSKRIQFLENCNINTKELHKLSFESIYDIIRSNKDYIESEDLKKYFYYSVTKLVKSSLDSLELPIDDITVKIKWPKNASSN